MTGRSNNQEASFDLLILVHERDEYEHINYLIKEMAALWRDEGLRVGVQHGTAPQVEARLAILHIDLTRVPRNYLRFVSRFPRTINGAVADISKRSFSRNLVLRGDGYSGPVIVKTNRNFRGMSEKRNISKKGGLAERIGGWRKKLPWGWQAELEEYRIFPSPREVPLVVWFNRDLVIERFLAERDGAFYCLRTWVFLGDRETHSLSWSNEPLVKSENVLKREPLGEVPAALRQIRAELGFDYGKFDYALVDGSPVLYDVNRTPALGFVSEGFKSQVSMLATGIHRFL